MTANILDLFGEIGLKPVKKTQHEYASPCPCCGGTDRCSIWPEKNDGKGYYWCRQCDVKGDGIQLLRDYADMTYAQACKRVGVTPVQHLTTPSLPKRQQHDAFERVDHNSLGQRDGLELEVWKNRAVSFVAWGEAHLAKSPEQMAWLAARGLDKKAVQRYHLGYNPGERGKNCIVRPRGVWGLPQVLKEDGKDKRLWLPRGIIVPQIINYPYNAWEVERVRIRRLDADREQFNAKLKYFVVPGSGMDVMWLRCTRKSYAGGGIVVVVESELDAMLLHHLAGDVCHCVASMTSNVRNLSREVYDKLQAALCILVALDTDKAGADGWQRWQTTFPRAKRWPVPAGKDPGEAFALGEDLRLWVIAGLPQALTPAGVVDTSPTAPASEPQTTPAPVEDSAPTPVDEPAPVEDATPTAVVDTEPRLGDYLTPTDYIMQVHREWRRLPLTLRRSVEEVGGEPYGRYKWEYPPEYTVNHPGRIQRFLDLANTREFWDWITRTYTDVVTAENFLKAFAI